MWKTTGTGHGFGVSFGKKFQEEEFMSPNLRIPGIAFLLCLANTALAQTFTSDHPGQYTQEEIAAGSRVYNSQCQLCHGRNGDQISGIDLRRGIFRATRADEDLARIISTGTAAGMPPAVLSPADLTGVIAFIRAGFDGSASIQVGDATRGKALFEGKGECGSCHRVGATGPIFAPPLNDIGMARAPAALERSIRAPDSAMMPINRPVRITMREGAIINGRRLNEDTATVQVIDDSERLHSIDKRDIRTLEVSTESTMPAYAGRLTEEEIADLVGYLLTLRTR
jgi:putative heme-binding domain-containing protein